LILAEQTAEARAHLVGVDLVEPPDQLDDAPLTALSEPEPPSPPPPAGALIPRANHQHRATAAGPGPRRRAARGAAGAAAQGLAPRASRAR